MNASRCPESCEFRGIGIIPGDGRACCQLATRIAGPTATSPCYIDRSVCEACCRFPLLPGSAVNPVVASLVFSSAKVSNENTPTNTYGTVTNRMTQQFALRWLASSEDPHTFMAKRVTSRFQELSPLSSDLQPASTSTDENKPRIGLVGRYSRFGLGHQNRDIAVQLEIDRWLVPRLSGCADLPTQGMPFRTNEISRELSRHELEAWLDGLDVVLFVEAPVFAHLVQAARDCGVRVICIPNWEWLHPGLDWLDGVDLMLCPTRHTAELLMDWKLRFGFGWDIRCVPWPIDTQRYRFRRRYFCRQFVYVHGSGGMTATLQDAASTVIQRKGLAVLLAAARQLPNVPVIVYAPHEHVSMAARNVKIISPPAASQMLYDLGDVCVQPSHWEGLGLPLLECQAAGMPLITTNSPPMNEYQPLDVIPSEEVPANLTDELCIPAARIEPDDLARVMRNVHGRSIFFASGRARRFVVREHSWRTAAHKLRQMIAHLLAAHRDETVLADQ